MSTYKCFIKDISWSFSKLSEKEYELEHGKDSNGICIPHKQEVHFKDKSFSKNLVAHELLHTYVASCCTSSINDISHTDMEEIIAEIMEFHLDAFLKLRNTIYKELK